ncbi:hypothetical protein DFQ26_005197 [Actinomortierella ambigua]|nr:hypothetical protein DFQ26_005197 [Actinomortierella ambigua]
MLDLIIEQRIGTGGFGSVYCARIGNVRCAAKEFFVTETEYALSSIQNEIGMLRGLRHRHIVHFYDVHHQGSKLFVVMELAEMGSLSRAIRRQTLDWPSKIKIAYEILCGLEYVHSQGVLHRDLKSSNVLLTKGLEVRLCDFGLARIGVVSASSHREETAAKGTLRWMAPELFTTRPAYSFKSDM